MPDRWLDEGLLLLSEFGINGVRIDRLANRLGLTKGSFYHHFPGMSGYRLALLDHYERRYTTRYIDLAERGGSVDPAAKLEALIAAVSADIEASDDLEVAIRAWAAKDDDAQSTMERVDRIRMNYLAGLLAAISPDRGDAELWSRTMYLTLIGARHVFPPLPVADIRTIYDRLLDMIGIEAPA